LEIEVEVKLELENDSDVSNVRSSGCDTFEFRVVESESVSFVSSISPTLDELETALEIGGLYRTSALLDSFGIVG
jgi:hypothetical protein